MIPICWATPNEFSPAGNYDADSERFVYIHKRSFRILTAYFSSAFPKIKTCFFLLSSAKDNFDDYYRNEAFTTGLFIRQQMCSCDKYIFGMKSILKMKSHRQLCAKSIARSKIQCSSKAQIDMSIKLYTVKSTSCNVCIEQPRQMRNKKKST